MVALIVFFENSLSCGQPTLQQLNIVHVFGFKGVTVTQFTKEAVMWGMFRILHFVRDIKPFVGEKTFLLMFCMLSETNQDFLLQLENSFHPIVEQRRN